MKAKFTLAFFSLLLFSTTSIATSSPELLSRKAVSEKAAESSVAISELRKLGPAGLESLIADNQAEIARHIANPLEPATPKWQRLNAALDGVSRQKDSYLSKLYWYTDATEAQAAAKASGKPILSLRLLGNLDEEFSCANSRFFRSVLYSNATVSKFLREHFVLHWQSVRPAPRITIDFGDGRKLERTVTGNSIHYVLDENGRVIDALPGLYGPEAFIRGLSKAEGLMRSVVGKTAEARMKAISDHHMQEIEATSKQWLEEAKLVGGPIPSYLLPKGDAASRRAVDIAPLAVTKAITEFSILQSFTRDADSLKAVTDEVTWNRIAARHTADAKLDQQSIGLIYRQMSDVWQSEGVNSVDKAARLLKKLQQSIALDTVRNEYMIHTRFHSWLASRMFSDDVTKLNEKVYAELFLTPSSDPWLGLYAEDVYVALDKAGVIR
ncbi:MAG TPA: hypothetical protein VN643_24320 [Pyrinomonadaceae bacterium]|nr:hypothetical protein [Pyrinomonadaceae bacterium]